MSDTILPCFNPGTGPDKFPEEGAIVGRFLAGYGELELEMAQCVGRAIKDNDGAVRAMFQVRGETRRIDQARSNLKLPSRAAGLEALTEQILSDMEWCKTIRNQYAHCHWYPKPDDGLGFVNLEEVALVIGPTGPLENYRNLIDLDLLEAQEGFFAYVQRCFWHLTEKYQNWAAGRSTDMFPMPSERERPPQHTQMPTL